MALETVSAIDLDKAKLQLDEYGYVLLPNLIPRADALAMAERLMELSLQQGDSNGGGYRSLSCVYNHLNPDEYEFFLPLATNPVVLELARHTIGAGYQMGGSNFVWRQPGVPTGPLHADVPLGWFAEQGLPVPRNICFLLSCNWMLTGFTRDNGGTQFLPMSHRLEVPNRWPDDTGNMRFMNDRVRLLREEIEDGDPMGRLMTAEGAAGSVVVFHGAMWHRAGANVTKDQQRVGVITPYHARWAEPVYGLDMPQALMRRDVRDRMPEQVRRMNLHVVEDYPHLQDS